MIQAPKESSPQQLYHQEYEQAARIELLLVGTHACAFVMIAAGPWCVMLAHDMHGILVII